MPQNRYRIGSYIVDFSTGLISTTETSSTLSILSPATKTALRLEPKACAALQVLCAHHRDVVSKEILLKQVWGNVIVSDDALLRCISRLRKVLNDNAKSPTYIETVPKRGYRLICDIQALDAQRSGEASHHHGSSDEHLDTRDGDTEPAPSTQTSHPASPNPNPAVSAKTSRAKTWIATLTVAITLLALGGLYRLAVLPTAVEHQEYSAVVQRADNFYHQIRRADNEMAISLYEQGMALRPGGAAAQAGLANALVQKTLRWENSEGNHSYPTLGSAVAAGHFQREVARPAMERALALAEHAVRLDPSSVRSRKALGFVLSALGRFDEAMKHYQRALEIDPNAWQVLINAGEISGIHGDQQQELDYFERAYHAMSLRYDRDIAQIRPWYADMGAAVGKAYTTQGQAQLAEIWYRRVLSHSPLHEESTLALAQLLAQSGDRAQAMQLCTRLNQRLATHHPCSFNEPQ